MFSKIHINNFKTLDDFTCDHFKIINTFTGDNNTGKTTLLEALFLLSGYSDIGYIERLFSWRGLIILEKRELSYLFSHLQIDKKIEITCSYNEDNIDINYQPLLQKDGEIFGIEANYRRNGKSNGKSRLEYNPRYTSNLMPSLGIQQETPFLIKDFPNENNSQKIEHIITQIFHSNSLPNQANLSATFLELVRQGGKKELINVLNDLFDEDITDIFNANNLIEILTEKHDSSLPVNFLGGGMHKILPLFCTIAANNNKVLLIDEIENGLHYSKKKSVLYHLFKQAIEKETQLFITTHDADVIKAINDILEEEKNQDIRENFQHYSLIINKDGKKKAINYTAKEFLVSNRTSSDIRD